MNIVLVYPSISDSGFNTLKNPVVFNNIHPGLCYLSAACKEAGFKDVSLIDLRSLSGWEDFAKKLEESKPDIVGITLMSMDYKHASKCIDIVKKLNPEIRTVVGGYHPTIMPEDMVKNSKVDHIVLGEAEIVFPKLLMQVKEGRAVERVVRGERPNIDKLPFFDRELFDFLEMPYDFFLPLPFVSVLAGRGCSYNCNFCSPASKIMHGYRIRRRSADNVIDELRYLRDTYGFKSLQFSDDCFTEDKEWVTEFSEKYKKNNFDQPFICQTRADIICRNPDIMKTLKKAGLVMVSIGFESGNDRILKFINKGTTVKQNLMAAKICKRLGIKIWAFNMFGMPTETDSEAWGTVLMIRKIRPYRSSAAFFTPHPGSHFYEYCKEKDLSLIDDHDDFVRFPEIDKPKIKNIDYGIMRKMAAISKDLSLGVKLKTRIEKIFAHRKNKYFKIKFQEELKRHPGLNKMAVLRLAHAAGRI